MPVIRVLIADDHPMFRAGLERTLERDERFEIVGSAADGVAALDLVREQHPDVALLDLQMPGLSGFEVAARIAEEQLGTPVVIYTAASAEDRAGIANSPHVAAVLSKELGRRELGDALAQAATTRHEHPQPRIEPITRIA